MGLLTTTSIYENSGSNYNITNNTVDLLDGTTGVDQWVYSCSSGSYDDIDYKYMVEKIQNKSYNSVLVVGLGMGYIPHWIKINTFDASVSIHVIDNDQELIDNVTWLDESITIEHADAYTYVPSSSYDLIVVDIFWNGLNDETLYNNLVTQYDGKYTEIVCI
jgi:spermidine synthase